MDLDEFRTIALAELDAVHRLAYHLAWRLTDADDLVQETYLRALRSAATYRPSPLGIRPWLFKILHNVLHSRCSADQRRLEIQEDLRHEPVTAAASAGAVAGQVDTLDWEDVDERLKGAIDALSLPHRATFLLCAVEGLRYGQIAEVMDVPVGTVMSRLFRARAILAERLTDLAAERGIKHGSHANDGIE